MPTACLQRKLILRTCLPRHKEKEHGEESGSKEAGKERNQGSETQRACEDKKDGEEKGLLLISLAAGRIN